MDLIRRELPRTERRDKRSMVKRRSDGFSRPSHGYAIAARLEQLSGGALQLNMGTVYPALMRLEQREFVRGAWDVTENNRRARFYQITADGRAIDFYRKCGFTRADKTEPMWIYAGQDH